MATNLGGASDVRTIGPTVWMKASPIDFRMRTPTDVANSRNLAPTTATSKASRTRGRFTMIKKAARNPGVKRVIVTMSESFSWVTTSPVVVLGSWKLT